MKFKLINEVNPKYTAQQQILINRGIPLTEMNHYIHTTNDDVASFTAFDLSLLQKAAKHLLTTINKNENAIILVDSDCDGFTSAALLFNYLSDLFPTWVENHLSYIMHNGKQHGLNDQIESFIARADEIGIVLIPDAGSNDLNECQQLWKKGVPTIVLDHHICDVKNEYAFIINNQNCDYPNKFLSGVGVTWQFCRFLDSLLETNYADNYLDLVALGNIADMMSLKSFETKHLIQEGLKDENLKNPFITYMIEKNNYLIGNQITPVGMAFYIAPFINAIVRSGTMNEKQLIFDSMLKTKAFQIIPSTKRGHKLGEMEKLIEQAIRVATNVKARQTKAQDAGLELLESRIERDHLLDNKVILFLLEPGEIDKNIAGLVANKFQAQYQRPCCILTKVEGRDEEALPWEDSCIVSYQGSARGCDKAGVIEFKSLCSSTGLIMYATGHEGAFGLGIKEENIPAFIEATNEILKDLPDEPIYQVDYIWQENEVNPDFILDIADLKALWGKDMDEPFIAIKNLRITPDMVTIYEKRDFTLRIELYNGVSIILFKASETDCGKFQYNNTGYIDVNIIATCERNEWNGMITPQLKLKSYEVVNSNKYYF